MEIAQLTYRLFEDRDTPLVYTLWEKFSGWGAITNEQFHKWYLNTPLGRCLIVVAESETGELAGLISFIPAEMYMHGKVCKCLRVSAPILHTDFRQGDLRNQNHPAVALIKKGFELAAKSGYEFIYSLPALGWIGFMKLFPKFGLPEVKLSSYECAVISLKEDAVWNSIKNTAAEVCLTNTFSESYNKLWQEAAKAFPLNCFIVRNVSRLQWKISHLTVFEIKNKEQLIGYAAYNKDGLLVDILAANQKDLLLVFYSSLKQLHFSNPSYHSVSFQEIKLMLNPYIKSLLENIQHQLVNFEFAFGCCSLNNLINTELISPENWFIMPND